MDVYLGADGCSDARCPHDWTSPLHATSVGMDVKSRCLQEHAQREDINAIGAGTQVAGLGPTVAYVSLESAISFPCLAGEPHGVTEVLFDLTGGLAWGTRKRFGSDRTASWRHLGRLVPLCLTFSARKLPHNRCTQCLKDKSRCSSSELKST